MFHENVELDEMNSIDRDWVVISELLYPFWEESDQITIMSPVTSVLMWRWYRYWKLTSYQISYSLHPFAMKSSSLIIPFCLTLYDTITLNSMCHEAAKVIKSNTILMGWQWHWVVQMHQRIYDLLCLHKQGSEPRWWRWSHLMCLNCLAWLQNADDGDIFCAWNFGVFEPPDAGVSLRFYHQCLYVI